MQLDSRFTQLAFEPVAVGPSVLVPAWWLRLALRWTECGIRQLHGQLADDFGTESTAPLYRELEALGAERERLLVALASRAGAERRPPGWGPNGPPARRT